MTKTKSAVAAAVAALAISAGPSHSAVLTLGGGWEPFAFFSPGDPIQDYNTGDTDYTFTLTSHAFLNITDLYYNLDVFDFAINGVDLGPTSFPLQDFAYTDNPDVAFADDHFSHGSYALGPGTYDVTGTALVSYYGVGVAGIELAAPEPAAWTMMLLGIGAMGAVLRRKGARVAIPA